MSSGNSIITSTPKGATSSKVILREKQWNFPSIDRENCNQKRVRFSMKNPSSKENFHRSKQQQKSNIQDNLEKRRLLAIEAMKISEQRRLRLIQEDGTDEDSTLVESMANLSIASSVDYLPDGRLKLTRKEITARREKHRRIREFLAEQEARKKVEAEKKVIRKPVTFKIKPFAWTPRPLYTRHFKTHQYTRNCVSKDAPSDEAEEKSKVPGVIRYSTDEIREMNPFGYYFM